MYSYTEAMGYPALLKLKVEELADEKSGQSVRRDYILQSIEEEPISESKRLSKAHQSNTGSSTISISDLYALVKSYDKDFKSQPSSKVINTDGTPKVVYHGTTANFTEFKPSNGALGKGIYFTDSKDFAKGYTYQNGVAVGNVMECYLDIKNPYIVKYADNYDTDALREKGYDGILHEATGMYVAFDPTQIKSVDNLGTFDKDKGDIRYSKQLDIDGKEFVKVDDTTIDEKNPKDIVKALKQIAESKGFYDMEINGQNIGLSNERGVKEWVYSKDAKSLYRSNQAAFNDKMQSFQNANELIEVAKSYINEEAVHKKKFDNFARGEVRFKVGDNGYIADILVGIRRNQSAELYDIVNITPTKITENSGRYVTDSTVQTRQEFSVDSSVPQTNSNVNTDAENSSNSSTDIRYSKELMTAEEKKKVREAERAAYVERQLVSTAPLGGKAKAVSPTAKAAVAKKIASGMPGVSTAQVNEQLTKFDAYNHIKSLTAIYVLFTLFCRRKCVCVVYSGLFSTRI